VILAGAGYAAVLLLKRLTTAPVGGAGAFSETIMVVDEPLAMVPEGLMDTLETEGAPAVKFEIEDQFPYWSGLRAWTSQKYWVPATRTPAGGVNEVPAGVSSITQPVPQAPEVATKGSAPVLVATTMR
jgi:hypothetical protein